MTSTELAPHHRSHRPRPAPPRRAGRNRRDRRADLRLGRPQAARIRTAQQPRRPLLPLALLQPVVRRLRLGHRRAEDRPVKGPRPTVADTITGTRRPEDNRCWLCGVTGIPECTLRADVHVSGHLCLRCWGLQPRGRNPWSRAASALYGTLGLPRVWHDTGYRAGWLEAAAADLAHRRRSSSSPVFPRPHAARSPAPRRPPPRARPPLPRTRKARLRVPDPPHPRPRCRPVGAAARRDAPSVHPERSARTPATPRQERPAARLRTAPGPSAGRPRPSAPRKRGLGHSCQIVR